MSGPCLCGDPYCGRCFPDPIVGECKTCDGNGEWTASQREEYESAAVIMRTLAALADSASKFADSTDVFSAYLYVDDAEYAKVRLDFKRAVRRWIARRRSDREEAQHEA